MKNFEQLRYLQQLFDDNILSENEYSEQKQNILSTLKIFVDYLAIHRSLILKCKQWVDYRFVLLLSVVYYSHSCVVNVTMRNIPLTILF